MIPLRDQPVSRKLYVQNTGVFIVLWPQYGRVTVKELSMKNIGPIFIVLKEISVSNP